MSENVLALWGITPFGVAALLSLHFHLWRVTRRVAPLERAVKVLVEGHSGEPSAHREIPVALTLH